MIAEPHGEMEEHSAVDDAVMDWMTLRPHDSIAVANEVIALSLLENVPVTPMKLQKMMYFAHGWRLKIESTPLVDEEFQAWTYGPVLAHVYYEFKPCFANPVKSFGQTYVPEYDKTGEIDSYRLEAVRLPEGSPSQRLLREVWKQYKGLSAKRLSDMTHEAGTAWDEVWRSKAVRYGGMRFVAIPNHAVREEFDVRAMLEPKIFRRIAAAVSG